MDFEEGVVRLIDFMEGKGWRREYLEEHLKGVKDYEIDNETYEYLAEEYTTRWLSPIERALSKSDLFNIGLSDEVSTKLFNVLEPLLNTSYSNEQLLECGLEYLFGKYGAMTSVETRYFITNIPNHTWIKHKLYGDCCNISSLDTYNNHIQLNEIIRQIKKDDYIIFYHCTNWKSCLKIIEYGSVSYWGKSCLDFGILSSFYLTPDITFALSWGEKNRKRWNDEVGILVYRISKRLLASGVKKYKVKYFTSANDEWKQLTTNSRRCTEQNNVLDKYDFIYGPIVSNVHNIDKEEAQTHNPIIFQLATKTEKANKYLKNHYIGSIWIEKK